MSDRLERGELVSRIERAQEETRTFAAEQHKLMREGDKFQTEQRKLRSEAQTLDRDRGLAPWLAVAGLIGGVVSIFTLILHAVGGHTP